MNVFTKDIMYIIVNYLLGSPVINKDNITDISEEASSTFLEIKDITKCCFCNNISQCILYNLYNIIHYKNIFACNACTYSAYIYCLKEERLNILNSMIIVPRSDKTYSVSNIINIYRETSSIFSNIIMVCSIDEQKYKSIDDMVENINVDKQNFVIEKHVNQNIIIDCYSEFLYIIMSTF